MKKACQGLLWKKNGCTKQFLAVDANCLYNGRWVIASYDYVGDGTTRGCPRPHKEENGKRCG